jgi:SOS response regulatory protein OraA/RecX
MEGVLVVAIVCGGPVLGWIVSSLATNWRRARESEHLAALKQSLADRGMSAEEIERVIDAGRITGLKEKMIARGMSAADIERVFRAGQLQEHV